MKFWLNAFSDPVLVSFWELAKRLSICSAIAATCAGSETRVM
jgi:hypothetical protein